MRALAEPVALGGPSASWSEGVPIGLRMELLA